MVDRTIVYDILYALAAKDSRQQILFGECAPLASQAFESSLVGGDFPELWFELPLAGEPWFDLHVLTARDSLDLGEGFPDGTRIHYPYLFEWFASQPSGVRQLALSYDLKSGDVATPAAQLLVSTSDNAVACGFLELAGGRDVSSAYRLFAKRIPQEWFPCYSGVFPGRPDVGLRVECIPSLGLQHAYAHDGRLVEEHLRQVGITELGDTVVARIQALARTPYRIEFQFDVEEGGAAGSMLGASLRFASPPGEGEWESYEPLGSSGSLMGQIESWGLADDRWRLLADAQYANKLSFAGEDILLFNYLAFVKLRWRDGLPLDAKVYYMAGVQNA